jgi:hypothetical protein
LCNLCVFLVKLGRNLIMFFISSMCSIELTWSWCARSYGRVRPRALGFSAFFVLSFCRNHHLLQIFGRPQWLAAKGRSHTYVNKVLLQLLCTRREHCNCHLQQCSAWSCLCIHRSGKNWKSMGCRIKTSCQVKSLSCFQGSTQSSLIFLPLRSLFSSSKWCHLSFIACYRLQSRGGQWFGVDIT